MLEAIFDFVVELLAALVPWRWWLVLIGGAIAALVVVVLVK